MARIVKAAVILACVATTAAHAEIRASLSHDGLLSWSNSITTGGYYQIRYACLPNSTFSGSWSNFVTMPGTNELLNLSLPNAYQVVWSSNAFDIETNAPIVETNETVTIAPPTILRSPVSLPVTGQTWSVDWQDGTNWQRGWQTLCNIPATGLHMSCTAPTTFRLVMHAIIPPQASIPGMAFIPAGTFLYGQPGNQATATVESFYIDLAETTISDWNTLAIWALTNGYTGLETQYIPHNGTPDYPVHGLTYPAVAAWLNARSEYESLAPYYYAGTNIHRAATNQAAVITLSTNATGYRLPTEIEWERAARGKLGPAAHFPWGGTNQYDATGAQANYLGSGDPSELMSDLRTPAGGWTNKPTIPTPTAWEDGLPPLPDDTYYAYMSLLNAVTLNPYPTNAYGLCDMAGNVAELTQTATEPTGQRLVVRGGSAWLPPERCTMYHRALIDADRPARGVGFRAVR